MQKTLAINCATGAVASTGNLEIREGYYLNSVQLQNVNTSPLFVWIEYFYDKNETEFGEIIDHFWVRNTSGYGYAPARVINKKIESELSQIVFHVLNQSGTDETVMFVASYSMETISQSSSYDWENDRGVWAYDDLIERHTDAGTIEVTIAPAAGSWFDPSLVQLTAAFTGAEDVLLVVEDTASAVLQILMSDSTQTGVLYGINQIVHTGTEITSTPATIGKQQDNLRINYPDRLNLTVSSVPADDYITIRIRAKLKDVIPTVSYTGNVRSQVAYVNDYSQVI